MASMLKLLKRKDELVEEVYRRINDAESSRQREYDSAVRIQAWYRGQRVRAYLKFLNANALAIQCCWRTFVALRTYKARLKWCVQDMKLRFYDDMATRIQCVWRGFYSRKYRANYYSRKRYLEAVMAKNEALRLEMKEMAEHNDIQAEMTRNREAKAKLGTFAKKHHYLISTDVIPGVFNSPLKSHPNEMEFHLREARPAIARDRKAKPGSEKLYVYDPACKLYHSQPLAPLPPVSKKPQGPFRDPHAVQKQRYRPLNASLRVETDYYSVEKAQQQLKSDEWAHRLHDDVWLPPSPVVQPYHKLLHTSSKFDSVLYGAKQFRDEVPEKFIASQNFRSLVPRIPVFDKLNKTYSVGEV